MLAQVLVLVHGSAVDVAWADASPRVGAIMSAFYPGQMVRTCLRCSRLDAILDARPQVATYVPDLLCFKHSAAQHSRGHHTWRSGTCHWPTTVLHRRRRC